MPIVNRKLQRTLTTMWRWWTTTSAGFWQCLNDGTVLTGIIPLPEPWLFRERLRRGNSSELWLSDLWLDASPGHAATPIESDDKFKLKEVGSVMVNVDKRNSTQSEQPKSTQFQRSGTPWGAMQPNSRGLKTQRCEPHLTVQCFETVPSRLQKSHDQTKHALKKLSELLQQLLEQKAPAWTELSPWYLETPTKTSDEL